MLDLILWKCLGRKEIWREARSRQETNRMVGRKREEEERWGPGEKGTQQGRDAGVLTWAFPAARGGWQLRKVEINACPVYLASVPRRER